MISYSIDLSCYSDNQVAMLLVEGVITRGEFDQWQQAKKEHEAATLAAHQTGAKEPSVPRLHVKADFE